MDNIIDLRDLERRMNGSISAMKREFATLRTGRASVNMLDNITVDAYGTPTPLSQVGTINVPESRMLVVNIWDKALVGKVERALQESGLGINPVVEGTTIRLPIPDLNEERRKELSRLAAQYAESAKVSVRNVRRDGMEKVKKKHSDDISEDEKKKWNNKIQKITDQAIETIDKTLKNKQNEIIQI